MATTLMKDYSTMSNYPRALSSILISVGLLAVFITLASWILLSHPIGTVVQSYFYGVDNAGDLDVPVPLGSASADNVQYDRRSDLPTITELQKPEGASELDQNVKTEDNQKSNLTASSGNVTVPAHSNPQDRGSEDSTLSQVRDSMESGSNDTTPSGSLESNVSLSSESSDSASGQASVNSGCDLYHGKWFFDSDGPLYTNNSCPIITQMQNCQGNGRPDKEYESWRWKPAQCELPRFNATKFLELMSGKTLAFVGDSVARNQMESLLCLLWQVEVPKNRGNRRMQRWYFKSKSVMIVRIWSSWLVHQTSESLGYVPEGVVKVHLDIPDETFMQVVPSFDVVVLSSGHWFAKQSVYMVNNEIVGTQLWSPPKLQPMKINNIEAFGISVETSLTAMVTHTNYTGLTIVRSYSPDHYEGGAWNTGGSCTGKVRPILPGQLVENGFTNLMHEKQVAGFHQAMKKQTNRSKLKLMDVTEMFSYRHDGHPGPYRSPDPNKVTKRGPDGRPPPQDCLHWCMPGPVDTWNELMLEIIRQEMG